MAHSEQEILLGQPVSPGIALGSVFLLQKQRDPVVETHIDKNNQEAELARFDEAIYKTRVELRQHRRKATRTLGNVVARIFDAHLLILDDEPTFDMVRDLITQENLSPEYSLWKIFEEIAEKFDLFEDDLWRDRAQDVRDVCDRLLAHLSGKRSESILDLKEPSILVAPELQPSDVLQLDQEKVLGIATDTGGSTSHTAILTRSLGVPSVVGLMDITERLNENDQIVINGNSGKVILRPTPEETIVYAEKEKQYQNFMDSLCDIREKDAVTRDGHRIDVAANIELPDEARRVILKGGNGVGLYRTEYLVLTQGGLPSEELQAEEYIKVAKSLDGKPLIIRTFDLGGDKAFPGSGIPSQINPFLGYRAIRVGLDRPEMLIPQLRAILRASAFGPLRVMFPMISHLEELFEAKKLLEQAKNELIAEDIPFDKNIPVGIMVEVPAVAILANHFAPHVDFFSIGTNDLVQFCLAVDRGNEQVAELHQPFHPAVLRLIKETVDAGHKNGIWVGLCGEFAGNPLATLLLLGLGLDELSASPALIPEIKKLVISSTYKDAKALADKALSLTTAKEVRQLLLEAMKKRFKDMPIWFGGQ